MATLLRKPDPWFVVRISLVQQKLTKVTATLMPNFTKSITPYNYKLFRTPDIVSLSQKCKVSLQEFYANRLTSMIQLRIFPILRVVNFPDNFSFLSRRWARRKAPYLIGRIGVQLNLLSNRGQLPPNIFLTPLDMSGRF